MLEFLRGKATDRKLRLFACACVQRAWPALPQGLTHEVVRLSEDYADGKATSRDLGRFLKPVRHPVLHPSNFVTLSLAPLLDTDFSPQAASEIANAVTRFVGWECRGGRPRQYVIHQEIVQAERKTQTTLLRDIMGSPFRSITLEPACITPTVTTLAQVAYDNRAFERLPALAGALEEAGCRDPDILAHCRGPGPHVKGCWLVDLILGKK
jgi:hypothetical protein